MFEYHNKFTSTSGGKCGLLGVSSLSFPAITASVGMFNF
jgi:hypothetical protein